MLRGVLCNKMALGLDLNDVEILNARNGHDRIVNHVFIDGGHFFMESMDLGD